MIKIGVLTCSIIKLRLIISSTSLFVFSISHKCVVLRLSRNEWRTNHKSQTRSTFLMRLKGDSSSILTNVWPSRTASWRNSSPFSKKHLLNLKNEKNKAKSKRKKAKIAKTKQKNRKERNLECGCCFEIRTTPFYLKQNWKYRESVNVSCKAMDKPFDPYEWQASNFSLQYHP